MSSKIVALILGLCLVCSSSIATSSLSAAPTHTDQMEEMATGPLGLPIPESFRTQNLEAIIHNTHNYYGTLQTNWSPRVHLTLEVTYNQETNAGFPVVVSLTASSEMRRNFILQMNDTGKQRLRLDDAVLQLLLRSTGKEYADFCAGAVNAQTEGYTPFKNHEAFMGMFNFANPYEISVTVSCSLPFEASITETPVDGESVACRKSNLSIVAPDAPYLKKDVASKAYIPDCDCYLDTTYFQVACRNDVNLVITYGYMAITSTVSPFPFFCIGTNCAYDVSGHLRLDYPLIGNQWHEPYLPATSSIMLSQTGSFLYCLSSFGTFWTIHSGDTILTWDNIVPMLFSGGYGHAERTDGLSWTVWVM